MKFSEIEEEYCKQVLTILKKFEYEPNNSKTRKNIETMVADHFYDFIGSHNVNVYSNAFICDESNNTEDIIDGNGIKLTISIQENSNSRIRNIVFDIHPQDEKHLTKTIK